MSDSPSASPTYPGLGQGPQRRQRGRGTQPLIRPAMDELQQLHGEFDVPQPARPPFDLPFEFSTRHGVEHPPPHGSHLVHGLWPLSGTPDHGAHFGQAIASRDLGRRQQAEPSTGLEIPMFLPI